MKTRIDSSATARTQRGAALVIALLMLLVITLLAVAGMNSAAVEFVMAGNEQFRQNAFQASEAGIEQQLVNAADFVPGGATVSYNNVAVASSTTDKYSTQLTSDLSGAPQPALPGSSMNSFSTYHFTINSIGTSTRSASGTHIQGVAVLAPASPATGPLPGAPTQIK